MILRSLKFAAVVCTVSACFYAGFLALLTNTWFQTHAVYLHAFHMTWGKDLSVPEQFGFLRNQVAVFNIKSKDSENLFAWHILPLGLYRKHETELIAEPAGSVSDITPRLSFKLLREDPEARLVIHMHGAGGTVGSGYRVPNYRALSAGDPDKIHVLTFDYRGFGRSPGTPSERGVTLDAIAAVEWATEVAKVPPERIILFGQSMGSVVNTAVAEYFAHQDPPIIFAGHVLVASFVDIPSLASTYSIAGTIPLLGPLARFQTLFDYLCTFVRDEWSNKHKMSDYIRLNEGRKTKYRLTLIAAGDDWDIPWKHTSTLFWHAFNATVFGGLSYETLNEIKAAIRVDLGAAGTVVEWKSQVAIIREEILKYGLHDVIMGNPVITMAVKRIFFDA